MMHMMSSPDSPTPYNVACTWAEFQFINPGFVPPGHADPVEYEGSMYDDAMAQPAPSQPNLNTASFHISVPNSLHPALAASTSLTTSAPLPQKTLMDNVNTYCIGHIPVCSSNMLVCEVKPSTRLMIKLLGWTDENCEHNAIQPHLQVKPQYKS